MISFIPWVEILHVLRREVLVSPHIIPIDKRRTQNIRLKKKIRLKRYTTEVKNRKKKNLIGHKKGKGGVQAEKKVTRRSNEDIFLYAINKGRVCSIDI